MTVPDYSDPTPAYVQIADDLRSLISTGVYQPGGRLPSNKALTEKYEVADGTIRQALDTLRAEGVIATRSTRGTFVVSAPAADVRPDLKAVTEQLAELKKRVEGYDDLRARVGRMEAILISWASRLGYENPYGGARDNTEKAPKRGRAGR